MRLPLLALAATALLVPAPASALPPDCERYGDKPCIVFCEMYGDTWTYVQMLVDGAPSDPLC